MYEIFNSDGTPTILTPQERAVAQRLQRQYDTDTKLTMPGFEMRNALGFEIDITSLTSVMKSVTTQKIHEVNFADYIPVVVGEGAWSSQLTKYRSFDVADDFETGVLQTGASHSKLASVGTAVDALNVPVVNWGKEITYSLIDLQQASRSGNWDLVESLEGSRYRNWKTGLQRIAFLGSRLNSRIKGLLTMDGVASNTTVITKKISAMSAGEFNTFVTQIIEAYRVNSNRTAMPTHFIIPEDDFNGLVSFPDATYPLKTKLQLLTEAFREITGNSNFKIMPLSYAIKAQNVNVPGLNKNRYTLLNYNKDSIRMDIPVNYNTTLANSINGFTFQNVGFCQYSGAMAYRPGETLYFDVA